MYQYIEDTNSLKVEITFKIEIIMTKTTLLHVLLLNVKIYVFNLWASTYAKSLFFKTFNLDPAENQALIIFI